jgi:hypothetical protein
VLNHLLPETHARQQPRHRVPLGLLLLSKGVIDDHTLRAALNAQQESGQGRLGDWLRRLGAATEDQITKALSVQWSCPVFPLEKHPRFLECAGLVPLPILEAARMALAHYQPKSGSLYVAFADGIDHSALRALEQMFDCRTEACIARESALRQALQQIRNFSRPPEIVIDRLGDPVEIAHEVCRYAEDSKTNEVRVVSCDDYIWARLGGTDKPTSLLFRITGRPVSSGHGR